jgi:iron complex outermembrane receptor protein
VDDNPTTGSGLDARATPGFAAVDLYGEVRLGRDGEVRLGVDNVLDTTYAYHVNRANADPFNPGPVQVNEPGRSVWARAVLRF